MKHIALIIKIIKVPIDVKAKFEAKFENKVKFNKICVLPKTVLGGLVLFVACLKAYLCVFPDTITNTYSFSKKNGTAVRKLCKYIYFLLLCLDHFANLVLFILQTSFIVINTAVNKLYQFFSGYGWRRARL